MSFKELVLKDPAKAIQYFVYAVDDIMNNWDDEYKSTLSTCGSPIKINFSYDKKLTENPEYPYNVTFCDLEDYLHSLISYIDNEYYFENLLIDGICLRLADRKSVITRVGEDYFDRISYIFSLYETYTNGTIEFIPEPLITLCLEVDWDSWGGTTIENDLFVVREVQRMVSFYEEVK